MKRSGCNHRGRPRVIRQRSQALWEVFLRLEMTSLIVVEQKAGFYFMLSHFPTL